MWQEWYTVVREISQVRVWVSQLSEALPCWCWPADIELQLLTAPLSSNQQSSERILSCSSQNQKRYSNSGTTCHRKETSVLWKARWVKMWILEDQAECIIRWRRWKASCETTWSGFQRDHRYCHCCQHHYLYPASSSSQSASLFSFYLWHVVLFQGSRWHNSHPQWGSWSFSGCQRGRASCQTSKARWIVYLKNAKKFLQLEKQFWKNTNSHFCEGWQGGGWCSTVPGFTF